MLPGITGMGGRAVVGPRIRVISTMINVASSTDFSGGVYNTSVQLKPHSAGDLIIVSSNSVQGATIDTLNPPDGFTKLVDRSDVSPSTSRTHQSVIYYKVATTDQLSTEWLRIPVTGYSSHVCTNVSLIVGGIDPLSPAEAGTGTDFVDFSDPSAPDITLTAGKRLVLTTLFVDDDVYPVASPYPPGFSGLHNRTTSNYDQALWLAFDTIDAIAGVYDPGAFEATVLFSDRGTMTTVAFKGMT